MTSKKYPEGLVGRKLGMTQVFNAEGECIPVTIIEAGPNVILNIKGEDKDGYSAAQIGFAPKKTQRLTKAESGFFNKAAKGAFYHVQEIRCDVGTLGWTAGQELNVNDVFAAGQLVDVSGTSIGRGFSGVVRRHRMKGQPATRGTHEVRRHMGAVGCRKFPGKIHKGKRMPGLMGNAEVTVQNLEVVAVRPEDNVILVKGGIPGARGGIVVIRKAVQNFAGATAPAQAAA
jgi:large subunit ribosomal protein L3